jgi:hypothetical protein
MLSMQRLGANAAGAEELEATWWGLGDGAGGLRPWLAG